MIASGIPAKFPIPWANSAGSSYVRTIPAASQIGTQNGAASLTDGFPPLTFQPVASGGVPPFGQDMNGILREVTQWLQWTQAGGVPVPYDGTFQATIGGYPKGAIISSGVTLGKLWLSTADNNTTDPDASGAGWVALLGYGTAQGVNPGFQVFPAGKIKNFGTGTAVPANSLLAVNYALPFPTGVDEASATLGSTSVVTLWPPTMYVRGGGSSLSYCQIGNGNSTAIAVDWAVWGS